LNSGVKLLSVMLFAAILFLSGSLKAVRADFGNTEIELPDFLLRISEYLSKGNETRLNEIRDQMIEQERIKQERIESTKGAVLHLSSQNSSLLDWPPTYSFMDEFLFNSSYEQYGYVEDWLEMIGSCDGSFTHLHTVGWNEHYDETASGGEAFVAGTWYGSQWASGDFYVYARHGPDTTYGYSNFVMFWVTNDDPNDFDSWNYVGYAQTVSWTTQDYYMGTSFSTWKYVAVSCWTPPPYPQYYEPLVHNCVEVDCVAALNWY
jgi:hypothetical protein